MYKILSKYNKICIKKFLFKLLNFIGTGSKIFDFLPFSLGTGCS